jgi:hypothetical protein
MVKTLLRNVFPGPTARPSATHHCIWAPYLCNPAKNCHTDLVNLYYVPQNVGLVQEWPLREPRGILYEWLPISIRLAPDIVVGVGRYMVCKQNVSHKSTRATAGRGQRSTSPFSRGDTIMALYFSPILSH